MLSGDSESNSVWHQPKKIKSTVCLESLWKFPGHFDSTPILDVMNLNESFQTRSFVDFDLV